MIQDSWCSSLSEFPQAISSPNFPTQATRCTLHAPTRISIIKQITQNYKLSIQTSQLRVVSRESSNLITFVKSLITEDLFQFIYMHNLNIQITKSSTNYTVKPCLVSLQCRALDLTLPYSPTLDCRAVVWHCYCFRDTSSYKAEMSQPVWMTQINESINK